MMAQMTRMCQKFIIWIEKFRLIELKQRKKILPVGDVESSIYSTLHGSKNSGSSCGTHETSVQVALENSSTTFIWLRIVPFITINFSCSWVQCIQAQFFQKL